VDKGVINIVVLIINKAVINIEKLSINNLDEVLKIIHYFSVKKHQ
jgi:hypothetical protein